MWIREVVTLRCLNYLIREFAVRRQLEVLIESASTELFVRRAVPSFFKTWGVPEELRPETSKLLSEWANHVTLLSAAEKEQLQQNYLRFLEPFLDRRRRREIRRR